MEHQAEAGVPCVAFSVIHCSIVQRDIGGDVRTQSHAWSSVRELGKQNDMT